MKKYFNYRFLLTKSSTRKKISFNKASKQKTGGGPYQEMILTSAEEQIIQATGVDLHVEGLSVKTYGKPRSPSKCEVDELVNESMQSILENEESDDVVNEYVEKEQPRRFVKKEKIIKQSIVSSHVEKTEAFQRELLLKTDCVLALLTSHTKKMEEYKQEENAKLQRLLLIKERSLNIKEEEHRANMAIKQVELQIKTLELEVLKQNRS